jgi:hypothetical protein
MCVVCVPANKPWISPGLAVSVFEGKFSFGTKTYRGDSSIFFVFLGITQPIPSVPV